MEKVYKNKNCMMLNIMILFSAPFIYLLNIYPARMLEATYWISIFCFSFLFLYIVFIISTSIQLLLIKILHIFPVKLLTIYPFSYDGKIRCHPFRLILNIEGVSNSLILNLSIYINEKDLLKRKMKSFLFIRKLSYFITFIGFYILLGHYDIKTSLVFVICFLTTILLSYFQYVTLWY